MLRAWLFRRKYVRRQVFVNTASGVAYEGVLWDRSGGFLILKNAFIHEPRKPGVPIDGEVAIPEAVLDFVQFVPNPVREVQVGNLPQQWQSAG